MHTHTFSAPQAAHALEAVLTLMKERRFFLFRQDKRAIEIEGDLSHRLDPEIFFPALELDARINTLYATATREGEETILNGEQTLGVKAADLSDKQLVQCKRHTGGLDICRVYPASAFTQFAPASFDLLLRQETTRLMDGQTLDDYSPKALAALNVRARINANLVWGELDAVKAHADGNACVVLLHTRFTPSRGYAEDDFMEGKLAGIQLFPQALGYLFYKYSQRSRIVRHAYVVFNSSRRAHVNVQHWAKEEPSLILHAQDAYDCQVYFPVLL